MILSEGLFGAGSTQFVAAAQLALVFGWLVPGAYVLGVVLHMGAARDLDRGVRLLVPRRGRHEREVRRRDAGRRSGCRGASPQAQSTETDRLRKA